jgi:Domain of unknown function (DUF927)
MMALALAFVGPVAPLIGARNVAIQLASDSGSGKTPVTIAAGSVWGCHLDPAAASFRGFGETWNSTINDLERVARAHNHCFLVLDETRATEAKTVLESVIRLERGQEKGRLTDAQPRRSWAVPVLSTSNLTVDELGRVAKIMLSESPDRWARPRSRLGFAWPAWSKNDRSGRALRDRIAYRPPPNARAFHRL